jgi:hypothetical protein
MSLKEIRSISFWLKWKQTNRRGDKNSENSWMIDVFSNIIYNSIFVKASHCHKTDLCYSSVQFAQILYCIAQICRYRATLWRHIVTKPSGEHNHESLLSSKCHLKKFDRLVFELSGNEQTDGETRILKTANTCPNWRLFVFLFPHHVIRVFVFFSSSSHNYSHTSELSTNLPTRRHETTLALFFRISIRWSVWLIVTLRESRHPWSSSALFPNGFRAGKETDTIAATVVCFRSHGQLLNCFVSFCNTLTAPLAI